MVCYVCTHTATVAILTVLALLMLAVTGTYIIIFCKDFRPIAFRFAYCNIVLYGILFCFLYHTAAN